MSLNVKILKIAECKREVRSVVGQELRAQLLLNMHSDRLQSLGGKMLFSGEVMTMEHSLNILLVDDEEIVHQTVADYLRDSGHRVDKSYDPLAALEFIEARDYDLALVDIRMPCMNGLSFLTKVQEIRPEMSVVIITGQGNMDMVIQALRLGAADFLTKPIKLLELDAVLEKSIRLRTLVLQNMRTVEALRRAHDDLEALAKERSAEHTDISGKSHVEITECKQTEETREP